MNVGLDTSALVRIISGEPPELAEKVARRLAEILDGGGECEIADIAAFEAYYALQHFYGMTKAETLEHLRRLYKGDFRDHDHDIFPLCGVQLQHAGNLRCDGGYGSDSGRQEWCYFQGCKEKREISNIKPVLFASQEFYKIFLPAQKVCEFLHLRCDPFALVKIHLTV